MTKIPVHFKCFCDLSYVDGRYLEQDIYLWINAEQSHFLLNRSIVVGKLELSDILKELSKLLSGRNFES